MSDGMPSTTVRKTSPSLTTPITVALRSTTGIPLTFSLTNCAKTS
jgi:hypothetical protein